MPHNLDIYAFELPVVEDWLSGDNRTLAFVVVDGNGDPVDISGATVEWNIYERPYIDDPTEAVLSGDDADVELVTDSRVDTSAGQWEVRIDGEATDDHWGEFWQRPRVEQSDGTEASWRGRVVVTA